MESKLISVIVPVYNAGKYFNHCIDSIVNQTYKNLEIIIVDDGSTDSTPKACDEWAAKDSRIKVIHMENGGVSSARNIGLDNANGEYIAFVDADDYLDLDMYEAMLNELIDNQADAVRCGIVRESENGYIEKWGNENDQFLVDNKKLLCDIGEAIGILPVSPCNKLFKKSVINEIRFDTRFKYAEDTLFNFFVAKNINRMMYHDVCRYHYINNSDSASHRMFDKARLDEHKVMDIIFANADGEVLEHCVKGDIIKSFTTIKQMMVSENYTEYFDNIRLRIIKNKNVILHSALYSNVVKAKTIIIWLLPGLYKLVIKNHGINADKKYSNKISE